jgi:hypothetical protein
MFVVLGNSFCSAALLGKSLLDGRVLISRLAGLAFSSGMRNHKNKQLGLRTFFLFFTEKSEYTRKQLPFF